MARRQGIFWILTIPEEKYAPPDSLPDSLSYIKGQLECGESTAYRHWQIVVAWKSKISLNGVKIAFPGCHAELSRSAAANEYVWKDTTSLGQRFCYGALPIQRNSKRDWEHIWKAAKSGDLDAIPADVRTVSYRTIRAIASDYDKPVGVVKECFVYWGRTGTGKSRRAWDEGGLDAYCKDPRTKFWCGYQGEEHVIIDEFRGGIDISHLLRWLDRYPVRVEIKGSSRPLMAKKIWITSNIHPRYWYPEVDPETFAALERRLNITEFE